MRTSRSVVHGAARSLVVGILAAAAAATAPPGRAQDDAAYAPPDQSANYGQYAAADQSAQQADPPARAARLAYIGGSVSFAPSGQDSWAEAVLNRPVVLGDRLYTGDDARAEVELGEASMRLAADTGFSFLNLDDNSAQVQLSSGSVNLSVRTLQSGQSYEIDTPTVAFVVSQPGEYRIDIGADGVSTNVDVFNGAGTVYGEGGVRYPVGGQQYYRFFNSQLSAVASGPLPQADDFDQWCFGRDARYSRMVQENYVSPTVVGAEDLDDYGSWQSTPDYGPVWYPQVTVADWAPYRYGHWAWIDPWGWTWVDNAPWGFAPFHYGRWVYAGSRWGWVPGALAVRPVYSPALVAFVGLGGGASISIGVGGGPVGWFPLGPRDVYCPPYRVSRHYFENVNVTNVRNVYINKTVINNYYTNVVVNRNVSKVNYMYRGAPQAATVVSREAFVGARPVAGARTQVNPAQFAQAPLSFHSPALPTAQSLALHPSAAGHPAPAALFNRPVLAHATPPPAPASFAARAPLIQRSGGAPVPLQQMQRLGASAPAHVNVISALPRPSAPQGAGTVQRFNFPQSPRPQAPPSQPGAGGVQRPAFGAAQPNQPQPNQPQRSQAQPYQQPQQEQFQHQPMTTYTPPAYKPPPAQTHPAPSSMFRPPMEQPRVEQPQVEQPRIESSPPPAQRFAAPAPQQPQFERPQQQPQQIQPQSLQQPQFQPHPPPAAPQQPQFHPPSRAPERAPPSRGSSEERR